MRIVIAEDAAVLRDGLVELLIRRGHQVVAAVADGDALRAAVAEHHPDVDVAVVDIRMPPTHTDEGLRAAIALRRDRPGLGVLVFSQYVETRYAAELLAGRADGVGYLLKDRVADVRDFVAALTRVAAGETVLDPEVVTHLLGASRPPRPCSFPRERWRNTSPASSPSSACRLPTTTTGGCWPSCATWNRERRHPLRAGLRARLSPAAGWRAGRAAHRSRGDAAPHRWTRPASRPPGHAAVGWLPAGRHRDPEAIRLGHGGRPTRGGG